MIQLFGYENTDLLFEYKSVHVPRVGETLDPHWVVDLCMDDMTDQDKEDLLKEDLCVFEVAWFGPNSIALHCCPISKQSEYIV